jgi:hypothetical protein
MRFTEEPHVGRTLAPIRHPGGFVKGRVAGGAAVELAAAAQLNQLASFTASTSTCSIVGAAANSSPAFAITAQTRPA